MTRGDSSHDFGGPNPIGGQRPGGEPGWGTPPPPAAAGPSNEWANAPQRPVQWPHPPGPGEQQWSSPPHYPQEPSAGFGGQPPYLGQQPYGQPTFGPDQPFAPPRNNRTRLWVVIGAAAAVVVLVVAGVFVVSGGGGSSGADTAGEAVKGYLEALARGDAEAALSFGETPPDMTFLTDEILKKQIEKFPITNIEILSDVPGNAGGAKVHVVANFGDSKSDDTITVPKPAEGQGWKLEHAAVEVNLGRDSTTKKPELVDVVTLFGKPAPKSGKAYTFPGWVDFGSSNPNIDVKPFLNKDGPPSLQEIWLGRSQQRPEFEISQAGQKAIRDQLRAIVDECVKSKQLAPPNCPNNVELSDLVDGTAQWTLLSNLDEAVTARFLDTRTATVSFWGFIDFGFKAQTSDGRPPVLEIDTSGSLGGEADMLQVPPKITLEE